MRWLIGRGEAVVFLGSFLLLVGAAFPWFVVPGPPSWGAGSAEFTQVGSQFQSPLRALTAAVGLGCLWGLLRGGRLRCGRSAGVLALLLIAFPHLVMIWEPALALRAAVLQSNAQLLSSAVNSQFHLQESLWRRSFQLSLVTEKDIPLLQFRVTVQEDLQAARADRLFTGLGYRDEFFFFMRWGYVLATTGALILLFGEGLRRRNSPEARWRGETRFLTIVASLILLGMLLPLALANWHLFWAREYRAEGRYEEAIRQYAAARRVLPLVDYDSSYHFEVGELAFRRQGLDDPDYHLYEAGRLFDQGRYQEARLACEEALRRRPGHPVGRLLLAKTYANLGTIAFNQGLYSSAIELWKELLRIDPPNLLAHFGLMEASFQLGDHAATAVAARKVIALNRFWLYSQITLISQGYMHLAWVSFWQGRYGEAVEFHQTAIEPARWR